MRRVAIIGSCVTRDAFRPEDAGDWQITAYHARTSLASAMAEVPFEGVELDAIESAFQRRMVRNDLTKVLSDFLVNDDSDLLVYDPIDERFDLLRHPGSSAICTCSVELTRATSVPDGERIRSGSAEFYALWEAGWQRFLELLDARGRRGALRINAARWAYDVDDGGDLPAAYPPVVIEKANEFLERLYARMRQDVEPWQLIEPALADALAAREHQWGVAPFHYVESFYGSLRAALRASAPSMASSARRARERRFSGDGDRHFIDVVGQAGDGDLLDVEVTVSGWQDLRYVAIGTVAGGVFHRMLFSSVEQDENLRLSLPRDLLTDSGGASGAGGAIEAVRIYIRGVPRAEGARIVVSRAQLVDRGSMAPGTGELRVAGWHPGYQVPIAEATSAAEFRPARGLVALYPIDIGATVLWTMAGVRRSGRLAVGFHGAADRRSTEYPYFDRVASCTQFPWSFLLFSDPTVQLDPDMAVGWFLGTGEVDLIDVLRALTDQVREVAGASAVAVSGASGGGFAALQLSAHLPNSVAVVLTPQTVLWRYHLEHWERAAFAVFGTDAPDRDTRIHERASVLPRYRRGTSNLVDFIIDQDDIHHVREHAAVFAEIFDLAPSGGVSADGRVEIIPVALGGGRLPYPRDLLGDHLARAFERLESRAR